MLAGEVGRRIYYDCKRCIITFAIDLSATLTSLHAANSVQDDGHISIQIKEEQKKGA